MTTSKNVAGDENIATVRVNESIGETTAQFMPPSNFNQTPIINSDEPNASAKKDHHRHKSQH